MPMFSVMGGVLFLGESPSIGQLAGGAVVLIGVAIITVERRPQPAAAP
jgi:O-acetylserine/cysteine efflux transporter